MKQRNNINYRKKNSIERNKSTNIYFKKLYLHAFFNANDMINDIHMCYHGVFYKYAPIVTFIYALFLTKLVELCYSSDV